MLIIRALFLSLCPTLLCAQSCTDDAVIVFDGSGSMSEMGFNLLDEPRIFEARRAIARAMPQVEQFRKLGLIIYGPGENAQCSNIDIRFEPVADAADRIITDIENLQPDGMTPLTASVRKAAELLDYRNRPGTVVLVTDGNENCGGAPCQLGEQLMAEAEGLTIHVIGFKVRGDFFSWDSPENDNHAPNTTVAECLAERTGGQYVNAETVDELIAALQETLGCQVIGRLD